MNCGTGLPLPILYLSLGNIKYELWYRIITSYSLSLFRKHSSMNCGTGLPLPILCLSLGNIKYELWYRIITSYSLSLFRKH